MKKTILSRLIKLEAFMGLNEKRYVVVVPGDVYDEMVINAGQTDWEPEGGWPENPHVTLRETMTKEAWLEKYEGGRYEVTEEEKAGWLKWQELKKIKRSERYVND